MRLYVADGDWQELTTGDQRAVRVAASDLQQARRARTRIRADRADVAVILDVTVAVAADFRTARGALGPADSATTMQYAGTVDGLTGLLADIESAGVADGVTLIAASADQDVRAVGHAVLRRLAARDQARAS